MRVSAPWTGDLRGDGWDVVDANEWRVAHAETVQVSHTLAHRANAYPALVEALREADKALRIARMWVSQERYPEMVSAQSVVAAALAATKEGESDG